MSAHIEALVDELQAEIADLARIEEPRELTRRVHELDGDRARRLLMVALMLLPDGAR